MMMSVLSQESIRTVCIAAASTRVRSIMALAVVNNGAEKKSPKTHYSLLLLFFFTQQHIIKQ
jgi:hypothetical protein